MDTQSIPTQAAEVTDERPHGCINGVVYIGHMLEDDSGEEVEVFDAVPCRRCSVGEDL